MFARLSLALLCLGAGAVTGLVSGSDETIVAFLSVGQGDCTLIKSRGRVVLIDSGPRTDTFDAGKRLVIPELRRLGVIKIDCVFITHPDIDHVGGLRSLSRRFRIGQVVVSREFRSDEALLTELQESGVSEKTVIWVSGITQSVVSPDCRLTVAAPDKSDSEGDNEGSLFIRIDTVGGSLMTTGDANSETEGEMSDDWDWDVSVLKAGHHGSGSSMSSWWLSVTSPSVVVASCGVRNRYGHPKAEAVERVEQLGAKFLRTDRDGTVVFRAGNNSLTRAD